MFDERLRQKLALQKKQGLYRRPPITEACDGRTVTVCGRRLINFASNDYLGLGRSACLGKKLGAAFEKCGSSSSSSRLVSGNAVLIREAEKAYASYFGHDDALFFPSGYQANLALLSTLFGRDETLFFDKHVHASTVKGMQLGASAIRSFKHNSMNHLDRRLKGASGTKVVVTESLFSMDGDMAPFSVLGQMKKEHGLLLVVDEAHAFGALGNGGRGLAQGVADVALGTFGKAMGLFGAFVLLPSLYREYLLNFASPFIYTTALPAAHAQGALCVLEAIQRADEARARLAALSQTLKDDLKARGFEVRGDAHILAIEIGSEERAQRLVASLFEAGFFAFTARFPTVPLGQAIVRVSLTTHLTFKDISAFAETLSRLSAELPS